MSWMFDHEHDEPVTMGLLAGEVLKGVKNVDFKYGGCGLESYVVSSLRFMKKHFRHQGTKTRRIISIKGFTLCLGVFVAIHSGLSGLGDYSNGYCR